MKRRLISSLLCVALCTSVIFFAVACSDSADDTTAADTISYSVDNTATELTAAVNAALTISSELAAPDPTITMAMFGDASAHFETFSVLTNASGLTQDEYGIFKADADENIPQIEAAVKEYLAGKLAAFTGDYTPEEKPKLENASVKTFGRFVVYCILSEEDTATVFDTVENVLLGK